MTTLLEALTTALADVERQVERCMALAQAAPHELSSDARQAAADAAVSAYEAADHRVGVMLGHIIAAGGCPGLLDVLTAACDRASERALQPLGHRGRTVAQHARKQAQGREQLVIAALALPYWRTKVEAANATP